MSTDEIAPFGVEEITNGVEDLNPNWPAGNEQKSEGDDHIRLVKRALRLSLPDAKGAYRNAPTDGTAADLDPASVTPLFWSPKALADFIQKNINSWLGTVSYLGQSFSVHRNGVDFTITATPTLVPMTTAEWNDENQFNLNLGRHVPQYQGRYLYLWQWMTDPPGSSSMDECGIQIRKNGNLVKRSWISKPSGGATTGAMILAFVDMNGTTDYVEPWAYQQYAASDNIEGRAELTYFQGCLISEILPPGALESRLNERDKAA